MYHKITIVGNLGRDPEMRYTPQGKSVTTLSVAANRRWTGEDGTPGEETCWYRVTTWGNLAEACNQYLEKGRLVLVEGRLRPDPETGRPRIWTRQDGTVGASYEVVASTVKFLAGSREEVEEEPVEEKEELPF